MARSYLALFTYLLNSAVVGREYSDLGLHVNGWMRYLARPDERKLCVCVCVCVCLSVAGVVGSLAITERGSYHLVAEWTPPSEPNGIILNYIVTCRVGES